MSLQPFQLSFYKGVTGKFGAIQFNPQRPHYIVKDNPKLKNFNSRELKEEWKAENPNLDTASLVEREGVIFMTITSAKDKNVYDWEKKIVMALSITDLSKILEFLMGRKKDAEGKAVSEIKIMHDPGAGSETKGKTQKWLNISSPKGLHVGVMFNATKSINGGDKVSHSVPLSSDEVILLITALQGFIPAALAWS